MQELLRRHESLDDQDRRERSALATLKGVTRQLWDALDRVAARLDAGDAAAANALFLREAPGRLGLIDEALSELGQIHIEQAELIQKDVESYSRRSQWVIWVGAGLSVLCGAIVGLLTLYPIRRRIRSLDSPRGCLRKPDPARAGRQPG